ncbi:hypothetical protein AAU61_14880 [Desulfocarbo indianensis]|nr:hypothetical protein AAU61_14880 [Desulfocarbo indianensis]
MELEGLIAGVSRPARYVGGEAGSRVKSPEEVRLYFALAFPEIYEIAMSHLGLKILYELLNSRPEVAAERVFMPWTDLMDLMDQKGLAPWSLESGRQLGSFDVIGFSLQYELTYANLLHMLRLAGLPLRRAQRGLEHPLVIAGGPCMVNPEPLADFLDLAVVGEAEEMILPLTDLFLRAKQEAWPRERLYREASELDGVYAPSLFEPVYQDGRLKGVRALDPARPRVRRRVVADLETCPPPVDQVVPLVKPVHDRLGVEIARGCTRGCRFCQAGYIYRPVRERSPAMVNRAALEGLAKSGLEELALLSLSSGDYSCIEPLARLLMDQLEPRRWSLSLPSLRVDSLSDGLVRQVKRVRKSGFTLAPEAGSQRLRQAINKDLTEEQILATARRVYELGWNLIKLYFMIGLPLESDEDLAEIGRLCQLVAAEARSAGRGRGKKPVVHASLGIFVPKPHTPFQWEAQVGLEEARRRLGLAKAGLKDSKVRAKWNSPEQSVLEGILSRGDRRLSRVLELAVAAGCRFDGWSEELNLEAWLEAMRGAGLDLADYLGPRSLEGPLPWDHIDVGATREFLLAERRRAADGVNTPDCRHGRCGDCGVCDHKLIKPRLTPSLPDLAGALPAPPPQDAAEGERITYRFRLEKTGPARFLGHLEMISQIVRALQRAGVRVAFSLGFHPHPLVKTASALPLGVESLVETLSVTVQGDPIAPRSQAIERAVNPALPAGLKIADGRLEIPGEGLAEPDEVTYLVRSRASLDPRRLRAFQEASESSLVRVTPKGERAIDLKAALKDLAMEEQVLRVTVGRAGGRPKPAEILTQVFGLSQEDALAARALKIKAASGAAICNAAAGEA